MAEKETSFQLTPLSICEGSWVVEMRNSKKSRVWHTQKPFGALQVRNMIEVYQEFLDQKTKLDQAEWVERTVFFNKSNGEPYDKGYATCRGCLKLLAGYEYCFGGQAYHPETQELCKVNTYGGFICSPECDETSTERLENSQPGNRR